MNGNIKDGRDLKAAAGADDNTYTRIARTDVGQASHAPDGADGSGRFTVFLDSGDTIIDQATEVRDYSDPRYPGGIVVSASPIPGAVEAVRALKEGGRRLYLVADGYWDSFRNILGDCGVLELFDGYVVSELVRAEKPDRRMFDSALALSGAQPQRCVMIGNNLARDIAGAKAAGIHTIHIDWSPRYPKKPACAAEEPDALTHLPAQWPAAVEALERGESYTAP